jgi:hypothetical protein
MWSFCAKQANKANACVLASIPMALCCGISTVQQSLTQQHNHKCRTCHLQPKHGQKHPILIPVLTSGLLASKDNWMHKRLSAWHSSEQVQLAQ